MNISEDILALLIKTHPRVYSVVSIAPGDRSCLIKFGEYRLAVYRSGEHLSTSETFSHVCGIALNRETNILGATLFLRHALTEFDTRVFIAGTQPDLPSEVRHIILDENERMYRLPFTWSYSESIEVFMRLLYDNRAAIMAILPQPIAEEVIEHYAL